MNDRPRFLFVISILSAVSFLAPNGLPPATGPAFAQPSDSAYPSGERAGGPGTTIGGGARVRGLFPSGESFGRPAPTGAGTGRPGGPGITTGAGGGKFSSLFPSGGRRGAPTITSSGGTRSGDSAACLSSENGELALNALTPYYNKEVTTASANPTFYVYVPRTRATTLAVELTDEQGHLVAKSLFPFALAGQSGIVRLPLQPTTPLVPGKTYSWEVYLVCDTEFVERNKGESNQETWSKGTLEYRPLDEASDRFLKTKNLDEIALFYAQRGDWLDTLDNAARAKSQNPDIWKEMLESVGLEILVNQPLLDCCTARQEP